MNSKTKIIAYFRLLRFHAAATESIFILLGALLMGLRDIFLLLILFIIGLFGHIYGYVLNEYVDIELDKKSFELQKKPLVSGVIPKKHALILIISAFIGAYVLTFLYFRFLIPFCFLSLAMLFGGIYNVYKNKIHGFSDVFIAGSLAFTFFFGVSTVTFSFTTIIYIVGLLLFVAIVFVNVVEGGLKDVAHDFLAGRKTLAIILGVKVTDRQLKLTKKFSAVAWGLIAGCFALLFLLFMQPELNVSTYRNFQSLLLIILSILVLFIVNKFLHLRVFDRSKIKRFYAVINTLAGVMLFLVILPLIGLDSLVILLVLPVTWYVVFNTLLYGKPLQPDV